MQLERLLVIQLQLSMLVLLAPFCCPTALSHKVLNDAKADRLVSLKLPKGQVGLAMQPYGCRQPIKLRKYALHLAFQSLTWQVGPGTAAKGLAILHLLLTLHWPVLLLPLSPSWANLHLRLGVLWLLAQQLHDKISLG